MSKSALHLFAFALSLFACSPLVHAGPADISESPEVRPGDTVLDIGNKSADENLGFGWSRPEGRGDDTYRWISHLEGDVYVDLSSVSSMDLWIRAAPYYLNWKQQNIGLYVNAEFAGEIVCPADSEFRDYHFPIPAKLLKVGRNTLTLRMGYRYRAPKDKRELSLRVKQVLLRPR